MSTEFFGMKVDPAIDATGSSFMGNIKTSYAELVEVFGEPIAHNSADGKVTTEWKIEFGINDDLTWAKPMHPGDIHSDRSVIATIYDWKTGETPLGEYNWHIGGHNIEAAWFVQDMIDAHREKNIV